MPSVPLLPYPGGSICRLGCVVAWLSMAACTGLHPVAEMPTALPMPIVSSEFIFESAPYPYCHTATVAEAEPGVMIAAWCGGRAEKARNVGVWMSRQEAGRWSVMTEIANGDQPDGSRFSSWNPVLFQPTGGPLVLFYKVGPGPTDWWGMLKTSTDGGRTWSAPRRLPAGVLGPTKNQPLLLADGTWLCGSSREGGWSGWGICFERSLDGGKTWETTERVESGTWRHHRAIQPALLTHADGTLQALCRTRDGDLVTTWSRDDGRHWSALETTGLPNPNSGIAAITLRDGRHLLVYNHVGMRLPVVSNGPRYPLDVAISDDGRVWRHVMTLETEPDSGGYAYPSMVQAADGLVHIVYSWHRERIRHVVLDPRGK